MGKTELLIKLTEKMEADLFLPLISNPEDIIPGNGNPDAKIMFIGEAGGYNESVQRKPFVGRAGGLLNDLLQSINVLRSDVYITNMVKTRPPENRDPTPEELFAYGKYLDEELSIIKPKIVVTLGRFSMSKFLPGVTISKIHGRHFPIVWSDLDIVVIPMYHPAAGLRNSSIKNAMFEDFKTISKIITLENEKEKNRN